MVRLIDNQNIEGVAPRGGSVANVGIQLPQQALGSQRRQPRHAHDHAGVEPERVRIQAVAPACRGHEISVDDHEVKTELVAHLIAPLQLQARWTHHDNRACPVPQQQLLDDQSRLDRLSQADIVGQQQIGPGRLQGAAEWFQLVGLDCGATTKRCLIGSRIRRCHCAPPDCVDERGQDIRVVEIRRGQRLRQPMVGLDAVTDLEFPYDRQLLTEAILLQRLESHHMSQARHTLIGGAARQALGLYVGDCPGRAAYLHHPAG